jgi:hypothetical protein
MDLKKVAVHWAAMSTPSKQYNTQSKLPSSSAFPLWPFRVIIIYHQRPFTLSLGRILSRQRGGTDPSDGILLINQRSIVQERFIEDAVMQFVLAIDNTLSLFYIFILPISLWLLNCRNNLVISISDSQTSLRAFKSYPPK